MKYTKKINVFCLFVCLSVCLSVCSFVVVVVVRLFVGWLFFVVVVVAAAAAAVLLFAFLCLFPMLVVAFSQVPAVLGISVTALSVSHEAHTVNKHNSSQVKVQPTVHI